MKLRNHSPKDPVLQEHLRALWEFLKPLGRYYPKHWAWFKKAITEIEAFERNLLVAEEDGQLAGVAIFKDKQEQKICTLAVHPAHRRQGIGGELLCWITDIYRLRCPFITVPEEEVPIYDPFLGKHGFYLEATVPGMYRPGKIEHIYRRKENRL